jgi:hypothetical protein
MPRGEHAHADAGATPDLGDKPSCPTHTLLPPLAHAPTTPLAPRETLYLARPTPGPQPPTSAAHWARARGAGRRAARRTASATT